MALYKYVAQETDGTKVKGSIKANDERDLKIELKKLNLFLVSFTEVKEKQYNPFFSLRSTVSKSQITTFMRQLSVMIRAGVSIEDAIWTLKNQESSKTFAQILTNVHNDLMRGVFLSEAFAKYPKIFPAFFKNMIYIAEVSGSLDLVLNKLADYYERDRKTKAKAKSAMIYPFFLFMLIIVVFLFLTAFIIPQFQDLLNEVGADLPMITRIVVGISEFVTLYFPFILVTIIIILLIGFIFIQTKPGKYTKDLFKLNFPIIKSITYNLITARFARGFGVLVASGMSIMDSIETIGKLMENKVFEKRFHYAVEEVKRGKRIARSVGNLKFFPSMMTEMLAVGEKTGNLDSVLETTANYYDDKLEQAIERATAALEPILIIVAGGMVGVVILSIFLPIISIVGNIG
jgi:type IV pilus assembly protein PilC